MNRKNKNIFLIIFIATVAYTGYAIFQLSESVGAHDGGLVILILTPFLLGCAAMLMGTFSWVNDPAKTNLALPLTLTTISLLAWSFGFYIFAEDNVQYSILYLGPFELFNALFVLFFVRKAIKLQDQKISGFK